VTSGRPPGTRCRREDDGSVLLLTLGFAVVALLLVAVVVDASKLFLTRRALSGVTDGAALAGAQGVDVAAVYAGAVEGGRLPLDESAVAAAVWAYLDAADDDDRLDGLRVVEIETTADTVVVTLEARARLPLRSTLTADPDGVTITVTARARLARRP